MALPIILPVAAKRLPPERLACYVSAFVSCYAVVRVAMLVLSNTDVGLSSETLTVVFRNLNDGAALVLLIALIFILLNKFNFLRAHVETSRS
jgi:DMSO/TMAO reductase YedYZ heme-binding membrane subunit